MTGLFDAVFSRGRAAEAVSGRAWLDALLRFEGALAEAAADVGALDPEAARAVAAAIEGAGFDLGAAADSAAAIGNPVAGVVDALRERVPARHRHAVHFGATSQDAMDTAMMLVAKEAIRRLHHDYRRCISAAGSFKDRYPDLEMNGRTLLQQAEPVSFGGAAETWAVILANARKSKAHLEYRLSYTGPGGVGATRDPLAGDRYRIAVRLGELLGLDAAWAWIHTDRTPVVQIGSVAAAMAGACGKVAVDVILLSQNEIGEVSEGRPGGSTSMPHKRNPVAATCARACAARTPGLVATLFAAMPQELQRSPGLWHSEWETLSDLLRLTGSAAAWLRESLQGLQVHPDVMERNLREAEG